jgi:hypothetical protein
MTFLTEAALCTLLTLPLLEGPLPREQQESGRLVQWSWGTALAEVREHLVLEPQSTEGQTVRYSSDLQTIQSVPVADCQLEFSLNKFSGLAFTTRGAENSHRMLMLLTSVFGNGHQESPLGYQWISHETHAFYDQDSQGDAYVYLYSVRHLQTGTDRKPSRKE